MFVAAVGYATLRTSVASYSSGSMLTLYHLDTGRPFDRRVLPSLLARPLVEGVGMCVDDAFWLLEFAAVVALLVAAFAVLRREVGERPAVVATAALLPVLALVQMGPAQFVWFAPYDTPACAFVLAGLYLARTGRYGWLTALCLPAALNRETAIMLPLAAVVLRPEHWRRMVPAVVVVLAVRAGIQVAIPGDVAEVVKHDGTDRSRLALNLAMLTRAPNTGAAALLMHLSCLPLLWAALWRDIPADLRRLGWVSLAIGAGMLIVGNVDEPRVFAEALVLAFVPVAVGVRGWAGHRSSP